MFLLRENCQYFAPTLEIKHFLGIFDTVLIFDEG